MLRQFLAFILLLQLVTGCAGSLKTASMEEDLPAADLSCSYFYFLWGTHAEYGQRFEEALEAYQKALICDPNAETIKKKVPVLQIKLGEIEKAIEWLKDYIEEHPDDTSQHLLLAHLFIQQKDREEAINLYYRVLEKEPDNEGILLRLGILHTQQQQYEEARGIFTGLIETNPELYLAHIYLARLHLMNGQLDEAATEYEKGLLLNWSPELVYEIVDLYSRINNNERVLELYTTILDNNPTIPRAALGRVQTLLNIGRNNEAFLELTELQQNSERHPPLDLAIAKFLLRLNKTKQAEDILLHLRADEETASEAYYLLGLIAYQNDDNEASINYLSHIPADSEDYAEGVYMQVRILRQEKRIEVALRLLQTAIDDEETRHPLFYALLSSLYQEQGNDVASLEALVSGNKAFPENDLLLYEQALLLERTGDHDQAMTTMTKVLTLKPDHAEALNFIGYSWADKNINLDKAHEYILRAVEQEPENGYIRDSLGWVLFRLGLLDEAREQLNKALELEPDDPHIYDHLGDVHTAAQDFEKARKSYERAIEMFESDEKIDEIKKKIDALPSP
ncbi:tetratricopeptide repeat protein [Desulfopila sp. IMCC35008]|uniref:tetratricopeptide repeat protein n=1 Tax=Desulfopila sp. IMCC35008 TaxID=2653858 RepID=UPI0013D24A53|nr:tetratricopeptide repeat protein [Desulfopila sp. IMCC35008]